MAKVQGCWHRPYDLKSPVAVLAVLVWYFLLKECNHVAGAYLQEIRLMNAAHGFCRCASGVKPASGRRIDGTRDFALRNRVAPPVLGIR
jgi:hypothetical protein